VVCGGTWALKAAASILGTAIQHEQGEQALRRTGERLRFLTAELIYAQEKERKRLGNYPLSGQNNF